jgi:hypothetical protein
MLLYEGIFCSLEIFIQLLSIASFIYDQSISTADPIHGIKAYRGRGVIAPPILNLGN